MKIIAIKSVFSFFMFFSISAAYASEIIVPQKSQANMTNLSSDGFDYVVRHLDVNSILCLGETCKQMYQDEDDSLIRAISSLLTPKNYLNGLIHFSCNTNEPKMQRIISYENEANKNIRYKIQNICNCTFSADDYNVSANWFGTTFFGKNSKLALLVLRKAACEEISNFAKKSFKALHDLKRFEIKLSDADVSYYSDIRLSTFLHHSIKMKDNDFFKLLFGLIENKSIRDADFKWTVLQTAVSHNNSEIVKFLCEDSGVDISSWGNGALEAFCLAMNKNDIETIKLLLKIPGINVNDNNCINRALHFAIENHKNIEIINLLLNTPRIVKDQDKLGDALCLAIDKNNIEAIKLLLITPGISVNRQDTFGETVFYHAIFAMIRGCDNFDVIELLLQYGADVNSQTKHGGTALSCAIRHNKNEIIKLLLNIPGINVNIGSIFSDPVLHWCFRNNIEVMKLLMKVPGFDPNIKDGDGETVLDLAIGVHNLEVVKLLLNIPGITIKDTALLSVVRWDRTDEKRSAVSEIVKLLLPRDEIDVNKQDDAGWTALSRVIYHNNLEVIKLLLAEPGINVNIGSIFSTPVLHQCVLVNNIEVMRLLLKAGIAVNQQTEQGGTALSWAIRTNKIEIINLLLGVPGIVVNRQDGFRIFMNKCVGMLKNKYFVATCGILLTAFIIAKKTLNTKNIFKVWFMS